MRKEALTSNRPMDFDKDILPRMKYQAAVALQSVSFILVISLGKQKTESKQTQVLF